jgi:hypothetical protein
LQKQNKSEITKCHGILVEPNESDIVIVDTSQLLYKIVWPHRGEVAALVQSISNYLQNYHGNMEKILVFDK